MINRLGRHVTTIRSVNLLKNHEVKKGGRT